MSIRVLHLADTHYQNNSEILTEVCRVADYVVEVAIREQPDAVVLAGDTLDNYNSHIRIDSDAARAAIRFVTALADVAPVVIVRGTRSHDRDSTYLFRHLRTRHPVHVSTEPEMVGLYRSFDGAAKFSFEFETAPDGYQLQAAFTLVPSLDKSFLEAESIRQGNRDFRELFHDLCAGFGVVNAAITAPRVFVGHGMVTGSVFSSGQQAIGEDLEMSLDALRAAGTDVVCLGHVHKFQQFGSVIYSGSPGRLNFGEPEEKGVCLIDVGYAEFPLVTFVPTPARRFIFIDCEFDALADELSVARSNGVDGAHVRVRFTIPEERRHEVDKAAVEAFLTDAGALLVKVESQILPTVRSRAAGISQASSLAAKVQRWADVTAVVLPSRVLEIAGRIEGQEVDELLREVANG
jgi:exonuclease SbcD